MNNRSSYLYGIDAVEDISVEAKRVFLRVDFNVPLLEGKVTDDTRIHEALPSIQHLLGRGAKLILASHLGRPKGERSPAFSMEPVAARLAELLDIEVHVPEDCVGDAAKKVIHDLRGRQVCLLENLRFHPEEEKDDELFAKELRALADVYINDAFGAAHRAHASVHAVARLFDVKACGMLVKKELLGLGSLLFSPKRPYVAFLGGAKVSDKISVIEALFDKVSVLAIGGAMANTFLAASGINMQASRVEADKFPLARQLMSLAHAKKVELLLPEDVVVSPISNAENVEDTKAKVADVKTIPQSCVALDIGPNTLAKYSELAQKAQTVFWNGPMGMFEKIGFETGTFGLVKALAESEAFTVVGGGDSGAAVFAADRSREDKEGPGFAERMSHISTGGGASLELIEGKKLPGIEVLRKAQDERAKRDQQAQMPAQPSQRKTPS